ncbi:hypothetical protein AB0395_44890 [Streptosporangium sp. NPDC051023]|uniref:hypothetical protein n=1 Tax=Streptosporangium sp. NPDC051023 TaxID=3155410 RepID=UPI00344B1FE3
MTDPITCPECEGRKGQRLGELFLACRFCGGLGWVGGRNEPAERGECPPPAGPPPVWEHRVWQEPAVAAALLCRYCLGSRQVTTMNEEARTMTMAACPECAA